MRQVLLILFPTIAITNAVKPPGYVAQTKAPDPNPPKYEYGYSITNKDLETGKHEQRDGVYAQGRYYIQDKDTTQEIQYFADDWGYHPVVEYSSVGPHSKSKAKFALGQESVQQLRNKENNLPQLQGLPDTGSLQDPSTAASKVDQQQDPVTVETSSVKNVPTQSLPEQTQTVQPDVQETVTPQQLSSDTPAPHDGVVVSESGLQQGNLIFLQSDPLFLPGQPLFVQDGANNPFSNGDGQFYIPSGPLYDDFNGQQVIVPQQLSGESLLNFDTFGMKIKQKQEEIQSKLIESTKHLVSGQDVLNINSAITGNYETTTDSGTSGTSGSTVTQEESYTTNPPPTEISLEKKPIVVAEIDENSIASSMDVTEQSTISTTVNNMETISTTFEGVTHLPTTVVVTPRPVSTQFLAPITAAVRLQNENSKQVEERKKTDQQQAKEQVQVEIQKTVPYYLGKLEYPMLYDTKYDYTGNVTHMMASNAAADLELSKTLLYFPAQPPALDVSNYITSQQLPKPVVKEKFAAGDHQQLQMQQSQQAQVVTIPEKNLNQMSHLPSKHVEIPIKVEKHAYITKHVPLQHHSTQRIIEKPIHIPMTKYVERPYPIEVRVPYPQPYPVEKVVQKIIKHTYPVEVRVPTPVERIIEKKVPIPQFISKSVPLHRVPIPYYVPYYNVDVPKDIPISRPQNAYHQQAVINRPQNTNQQVVRNQITPQSSQIYSVNQQYVISKLQSVNQETATNQVQPQALQYQTIGKPQIVNQQTVSQYQPEPQALQSQQQNIVLYATSNQPEPHPQQSQQQNIVLYTPQHRFAPPKANNGYLPPPRSCEQAAVSSNLRYLYFATPDESVGLLPPKPDAGMTRNYRTARSNFDERSVRMEYGFMPPLIPSLEIDEYGRPIEKGDK